MKGDEKYPLFPFEVSSADIDSRPELNFNQAGLLDLHYQATIHNGLLLQIEEFRNKALLLPN